MMVTDTRKRHQAVGALFAAALRRFALHLKYAEDQPRVPAGNPDGGQWTGGGGEAASSLVDAVGEGVSEFPTHLLAGDFSPKDLSKTVQQYVSEQCKAGIYEVLPGQFLDMPIADVLYLANKGDSAARRCKKLLSRGRFRK